MALKNEINVRIDRARYIIHILPQALWHYRLRLHPAAGLIANVHCVPHIQVRRAHLASFKNLCNTQHQGFQNIFRSSYLMQHEAEHLNI